MLSSKNEEGLDEKIEYGKTEFVQKLFGAIQKIRHSMGGILSGAFESKK